MANPHHRKKHREQVKHFKEAHHSSGTAAKKRIQTSGSLFLAIIGAVAGALIAIFAASGSPLWLAILIVSGFAGGYYIGRSLENDTKS